MTHNNIIFLGFIQLASDYTLEMEIFDIIKQILNIGWRVQKFHIK